MAMGPERIWGTFNLTRQEEADELAAHRYEGVSKARMKEAANRGGQGTGSNTVC